MQTDSRTGNSVERVYTPSGSDINNLSEICFEDFVCVTTNNYCLRSGHIFENIQAKVCLLRHDGSLKIVTIPAGFCCSCKKYSIGRWQFEELRKTGVLLCRVVQESSYQKGGGHDYYSDLSPESILKQYGYSVSATDGLSDEQRQQILVCLMESGICSKQKITAHLSWLIQSREGRTDLLDAVWKWKSDRNFVDLYKLGEARVVAMRSLKVKR